MKSAAMPRFFARFARFELGTLIIHGLLAIFFTGSRVVPGLITQTVFDDLTGQRSVRFGLWTMIGAYVAWQIVRVVSYYAGEYYGRTFFYRQMFSLQKNTLAGVLRRPGAVPLPVSPGDAVNRLKHDTGEMGDFPLWVPYVMAQGAFAVIALLIMARINPSLTLLVTLPLFAVILVTNAARRRLLRAYQASREATSRVSGFLGDIFAGVQAIKVADAEAGVLRRFRDLNEERRRAGLQIQLMNDILQWSWQNLSDLGVGLVLLLGGSLIQSGRFTVGDFTLFVSYLWFLVRFPADIGGMMADYRTQEVSQKRLLELVGVREPMLLLSDGPLGPVAIRPMSGRHPDPRLSRFAIHGLTYVYPGTDRGIRGVDLACMAGSITVITGEVGSGKTTLLRAMLGLLPAQAGRLTWNGEEVLDPAAYLQPPRAAYAPQVPRLFSLSLRHNIELGLDVDIMAAVRQAVLEADLATLSEGLDTRVGPRGVRLSGGQAQRVAAARVFAREPELIVVDDLSSALDVETEAILWRRLAPGAGGASAERSATVIAVSHRRASWRLADQLVVLEKGRVVGAGTLDELLPTCEPLQRLWRGAEAPADDPPSFGEPPPP